MLMPSMDVIRRHDRRATPPIPKTFNHDSGCSGSRRVVLERQGVVLISPTDFLLAPRPPFLFESHRGREISDQKARAG